MPDPAAVAQRNDVRREDVQQALQLTCLDRPLERLERGPGLGGGDGAARAGRLPDDGPVLLRADAPELFALVDEVAGAVGTRSVDAVAVDGSVNAAVTTYGVRGRRLLVLGMPLWEVLTPEERIALLGHELAHDANGDTRNGLVVGAAVRTLSVWHHILQPLPHPTGLEVIADGAERFAVPDPVVGSGADEFVEQ
ncbi:M48 family metallopeptidase [Streptomyces flaveolus]|uniref:M48 family metallopeptidase n=1 Tax=Streptomyces flaveolus TaxID=67297 RepID=UPI003331DBBE